MIEGVSHIAFIVKELAKATEFFEKMFDAKEVYSSGYMIFSLSREKFF